MCCRPAKSGNCTARLDELGQRGVGLLPEIQKAFVLFQRVAAVACFLQQPGQLEHISRLDDRDESRLRTIDQQPAVELYRLAEAALCFRGTRRTIPVRKAVHERREPSSLHLERNQLRRFSGGERGSCARDVAARQGDLAFQRPIPEPFLGDPGRVQRLEKSQTRTRGIALTSAQVGDASQQVDDHAVPALPEPGISGDRTFRQRQFIERSRVILSFQCNHGRDQAVLGLLGEVRVPFGLLPPGPASAVAASL